LEVAQAYTLFTNGGSVRTLNAIDHVQAGTKALRPAASTLRNVAQSDTTYLVTNMMRSVLNEGTGAAARANGFALDAAGKSGTTNDLRDAWVVGRLHAGVAHGGVGGLRRQSAAGPERVNRGTPHLDRLHESRPRRASERLVRCPRGHHLHRHRSRNGQARDAELPPRLQRIVHRRHRAHRVLPTSWGRPGRGARTSGGAASSITPDVQTEAPAVPTVCRFH